MTQQRNTGRGWRRCGLKSLQKSQMTFIYSYKKNEHVHPPHHWAWKLGQKAHKYRQSHITTHRAEKKTSEVCCGQTELLTHSSIHSFSHEAAAAAWRPTQCAACLGIHHIALIPAKPEQNAPLFPLAVLYLNRSYTWKLPRHWPAGGLKYFTEHTEFRHWAQRWSGSIRQRKSERLTRSAFSAVMLISWWKCFMLKR